MPRSHAVARRVLAFLLLAALTLLVEAAALALLAGAVPGRARADLLLNEVLYDPDGSDEGHEFVELWNPDSAAAPLEGISIESGDGARPGVWSSIYAGAAGDSVLPRRAFLIPGSALLGAIQNGPDALRLTRAGVVLDLVGYGALAFPELYRGAPAPDVSSGQSLARVQDGVETGVNASDWAAETEPSPGMANHPDLRLTIAKGGSVLRPEVPWPGDVALLRVTVRNRGRLAVDGARWRVEAAIRRGAEADTAWPERPAAVCPGVSMAPGDSARVPCALAIPQPGRFDVRVILRDAGVSPIAESAIADTTVILARSTAGPLAVNEIAFRDRGAGEWVELIAREDVPDLGEFAMTDAGGRAYAIDRGEAPRGLGAGAILVVAESPDILRGAYALPESLVSGCRGGWPALNDQDGEEGFADLVRIVDTRGIPSDAVPYRSDFSERGGSIERLGAALPSAVPGTWSESVDARAGTPGRPNSVQAPRPGSDPEGRLLLASSRVLRRGPGALASPVVLAFGEAARGRRVRVFVHDLLGRPRRRLVDGQRVLGEAAFLWDGKDDAGVPVPAGTYVARAETLPEGTEPARSGNLALTVVDR